MIQNIFSYIENFSHRCHAKICTEIADIVIFGTKLLQCAAVRSATQVCRCGTVTVTLTDEVCEWMTSLSEVILIQYFKNQE